MDHNAVLGTARQADSQAGEEKVGVGSRELERTSVGCAKPRPDSSEARGHALPGACSAVWHSQAGEGALRDSQQPPASSLSGGREPGTRMDRWRLAGGCRHSRLSTVPRARGWDWTKRRAATGRDGSTVLGPTYLGVCLFWEWMADSQDKNRLPWIGCTEQQLYHKHRLGREPVSIECRRSRLGDDGVAGHGVAEWRPGSGQLPVWAAKRLPLAGVSGLGGQLRNEPPGRGCLCGGLGLEGPFGTL